MAGSDKVMAALTPEVVGDQLKLALDGSQFTDFTRMAITPDLSRAREAAKRTQSMSNMRQIELGIIMFANENKGKLPANLTDDLKPYLDASAARVFTNPRHPERKPAYVYVRAAEKLSQVRNSAETVMLYESFDQWGDGINVGFADGHVEYIKDQKQFQTMLKGAPPAP